MAAAYGKRFKERLKSKLISVGLILAGALILALLLSVAIHFLFPHLPEPLQQALHAAERGEPAAGKDRLLQYLRSYGKSEAYLFMGLQVLQVLLAPIPGQLVGLAGGMLFGFWKGLFLCMVGLTIGSALAMVLGRLFGKALIRRLVPADLQSRFDGLINGGGLENFFMIFLLPALPDDAVCFIAGLTRLSLWKLLGVSFLGRLPGMAVLTFAGAGLDSEPLTAKVVFAAAVLLGLAFWLFDEELRAFFMRLSLGRKSRKT